MLERTVVIALPPCRYAHECEAAAVAIGCLQHKPDRLAHQRCAVVLSQDARGIDRGRARWRLPVLGPLQAVAQGGPQLGPVTVVAERPDADATQVLAPGEPDLGQHAVDVVVPQLPPALGTGRARLRAIDAPGRSLLLVPLPARDRRSRDRDAVEGGRGVEIAIAAPRPRVGLIGPCRPRAAVPGHGQDDPVGRGLREREVDRPAHVEPILDAQRRDRARDLAAGGPVLVAHEHGRVSGVIGHQPAQREGHDVGRQVEG